MLIEKDRNENETNFTPEIFTLCKKYEGRGF